MNNNVPLPCEPYYLDTDKANSSPCGCWSYYGKTYCLFLGEDYRGGIVHGMMTKDCNDRRAKGTRGDPRRLYDGTAELAWRQSAERLDEMRGTGLS